MPDPTPAPLASRPPERLFVIRLDGDAAPGRLSGRVEHVLSGRRAEFHDLDELQRRLMGDDGAANEEAKPCRT